MFKKTHKHHIIPKHMGGNDDPSNLIELTVEEHAAAHLELYKNYGKEQDKIAWQLLSGQINVDEARRSAASVVMKTKVGDKNSQFGSKWYNNGIEEKKIYLDESIPDGWQKGRIKKPPSRNNCVPWNKGKTDYITDELRYKFGSAWRGKSNPKHSEWMLDKKYHLGFHHSDETKKIMSVKKLGNKNRTGKFLK